MRYGRGIRVAVLLGVLTLTAACSNGDDGDGEDAAGVTSTQSAPDASSSPSPSESPYYDGDDNVLMAKDDCYGPPTGDQQGQVVEMPCEDPDAIGKVLKRVEEEIGMGSYADCPDATDDVLGITGEPGWEIAGSRDYVKYASGVGYACVRNLRAPHPGEPGGGGMDIDIGDCVEASDTGEKYEEVPCEGEVVPDGKVVDMTDADGRCPRTDDTVVRENSLGSTILGALEYCVRAYTQP
ncbi:hypothetical protein ABZ725_06590 [Streptomyces sp. NPDC006872]|uniref:hypothetical protein n=1 Tax=Streptomyces sp. NPDC006872 TaxID=3155720 RepID=UPI0033FC9EB9